MKSWFLILATLIGLALSAGAGEMVVIPLRGEVSQAQFLFLRRALKEAETAGASAIVLDMDTYGGSLEAAVKMQAALSKTAVPTATYVNTNAGSAGALIAVSTRKIFMAPISAIGAAAPVQAGGQELPTTMTEKVVSYFSGYFRSAAQTNGHNPDIAEAFINKNKEVKIGETVFHEKGSLLTLSAQEAVREFDGKPVLAASVEESLEKVRERLGVTGGLRRFEPTGFEQVAFWLTALAPLLLLGGIIGAYIEFKAPGFGIPGTVSIVCFTLFFAGHFIAGLAGWEVFVVFLIGVALVIGELMLHPGTVIPGLLGVALMLGALMWAMVDRYPNEPWLPSTEQLIRPAVNLCVAGLLGIVAITFLARVLPKTPLYGRLVLQRSIEPGPSLAPGAAVMHVHTGDCGVAVTVLRPTGRARFAENFVDVVTQGEFLTAETPVRVVAVEGSRVVVEQHA